MSNTAESRFESFALEFVRAYWQTVKSGAFAMPPNEPIEETLDELLASVSHQIEFEATSTSSGPLYKLRMTRSHRDWWLFSFRETARAWMLVGCSASSYHVGKPHDLLGSAYSSYFEPFLNHITEVANGEKFS